ncbi:MAG: anthranilate phosphoribosyltransferase [Clostridium sp.]|uniref:anthranilate phosphoribosyltransferase n=1 Tax=Clostridium sp. TaxID=1506 RepID=UPI002FCB6DBE
MGVLKEYILKTVNKEGLSIEEAKEVCKYLLHSSATQSEIGGLLLSLKTKGESSEEIAGMALAMKEEGKKFRKIDGFVMDNCGTGGDKLSTFNISTTCSFVLAASGVKVAKHGNRSISSKSGSSDLLTHLGVNINIPDNRIEEILQDVGIVFLFAPNMHPLLKNIMQTRLDLGVPTVFNLLGPLINPVEINGQMIGVYSEELVDRMCNILSILGRETAVVVNGYGGMDEASLEGDNHIAYLKNGEIKRLIVNGKDYGLMNAKNSSLIGGEPSENALITRSILSGEKGPRRDVVILNSAIGLVASGMCSDIQDAVQIVTYAIDSGKALEKLNLLVKESNR